MRPISSRVNEVLNKDPRMKRCALAGMSRIHGQCTGRIERHHVWIYAGRQIDESWAIVGACQLHHREVQSQASIRMAFEEHSLRLATDEDLAKYPRKPWNDIKRNLGIIK